MIEQSTPSRATFISKLEQRWRQDTFEQPCQILIRYMADYVDSTHFLAGVSVDEPREFHDRASGSVEDRALDRLGSALDREASPTEDGDFRRDR